MVLGINQINSDWLESHRNVENEQAFMDWYGDFSGSLTGTSRTLEVVGKVSQLGYEISKSETLNRLHEGAGTTLTSFGLIRIPMTTRNALRSIWAIGESNGMSLSRKVKNAVGQIMTMLGAWASAIFLLLPLAPLRVVTKGAFFASELTDFSNSVVDYHEASKTSRGTTGKVRDALEHSRNYYFYRIVRNITAIASDTLGLLSLVFGLTLIPTISSILLSLSVTLLSIQRDYFKTSGEYEVIDFEKPISLESV